MSKKTYDVSTRTTGSYSPRNKDDSFASMLCIMLVVLVICALLLILSSFYKKSDHGKEYKHKGKTFERLTHGNTTTESNREFTDNTREEINDKDIEITEETPKTTNTRQDYKQNTLETSTTTTTQSPQNEQKTPSVWRKIQETTLSFTETTITNTEEMSSPVISSTTDKEWKNSAKNATTSIPETTTDATVSTISEEGKNHITTIDETSSSTEKSYMNSQETESTEPITSTQMTEIKKTTTSMMENTERTVSANVGETTTPFVFTSTIVKDNENGETTINFETTTVSTVSENNVDLRYDEVLTTEQNLGTTNTTPYTVKDFRTTDQSELSTTLRQFNESDYVDTDQDSGNNATESSTDSTTKPKTKERLEDLNTLNFKDKDTCQSRTCNSMAARIISSMDTSRAPCEDFYNYACGGILVEEKEENDIFEKIESIDFDVFPFMADFRNFYLSCKNYEDRFLYKDRLTSLFAILKREVYGQDDSENKINELLANLLLLEAFPYLEIGIGIHPRNSSAFILELKNPKYKPLSSKYWSSFSESQRKCRRKGNEEINASVLEGSYIQYLHQLYWNCTLNHTDYLASVKTLREDKNFILEKNQTDEEVKPSLEALSKILAVLDANFFIPEHPIDEVLTIKDLQKRYPALNWKSFLSFLSNEYSLNDSTEIRIGDIERLMYTLKNTEKRDLLNVLESFAEYSIYENIVLQSHVESRTEFCKQQAKYLMPDIANYVYNLLADTETSTHSKNVKELFNRFKQQFGKSLENSEWIGQASKTQMIKKLNRIQLSIFSEVDYKAETDLLRTRYNDSLKEDDYPNNLIYLMKQKNRNLLSLQGQDAAPAKVHLHLMDAAEKKLLYFNTNGIAYVPYALVKQASKQLPGYLIMAQVGFALAKIIGDAFSPSRISSDITMDQTTRVQFTRFVKQMNNERTFRKPFQFNNQTLLFQESFDSNVDEMVSDNTAMRLLTDSLETFGNQFLLPWISYQFSREKIFFLGITQEFCQRSNVMDITMEYYRNKILPPMLRTENILMNSEEFSKHFSCDENSTMYVSEKLQFPHIEKNFFDTSLLN